MELGERTLPAVVEVLDEAEVDVLWERFEIFEALHHGMRICNPLTESDFTQIANLIASHGEGSMLDVACGYGEMLVRCASKAAIKGVGVDLSPWMVQTAATREMSLADGAELHWVLGDARDYGKNQLWDVVSCVGAEWIWHGFGGTVRALAERVRPGGLIVVGAARLKDGCDPQVVSASHGRVETVAEKEDILQRYALEPILRLDPDDDAWDAYLARTAISVAEWASERPGGRTAEYVAAQQEWAEAREHDREIIGWSAWVARATKPDENN